MSNLRFVALGFFFGLVFGIGTAASWIYYMQAGMAGIKIVEAGEKAENPEDDGATTIHLSNGIIATTLRPATAENVDRDDNTTAEQLYNKVRVLCWIMTSPSTIYKKAIHVRDTWSSRCNIRLFMSSAEDKTFPAVGLPVKEGRDQLYEKTKAAFKYAWDHYHSEVDWFMKADDDSFVVVENLRYLLKDYDPGKPIYFGRKFKPYVQQGYMSGGAGYVLSKEATRRFANGMATKCAKGGGVEDVELGRCMSNLGVVAGDSRDELQKERFHPLSPGHHIVAGLLPKDFWLWKYDYYSSCAGKDCPSAYPISFHYVKKDDMYVLEYMIYGVKVYGMTHTYRQYPNLLFES